MRIGLTGGQGFLGKWVRRVLLRAGHEVIVFDRVYKGDVYEGEEFFLGDIRDESAVFELAAHVDGIIHLAAVLGTQETIQNPKPSAITNIQGSLNVFEAANHYNLPVAYAGVGNHFMRLDGTGSYTISKSCAEDYARMYNSFRKGKISIVRPVNAYGPEQSVAAPYGPSKVRKIMPAMICRALTGQPIEIYGDGTQISDCIYVGDVAYTFARALEITAWNNEALPLIEIGPVASVTVNQIATMVRDCVVDLTQKDPVELVHLPMRPGETPNAVVRADVSTLAHAGIDPTEFVSLENGISRTVDYYTEYWLPEYLKEQEQS